MSQTEKPQPVVWCVLTSVVLWCASCGAGGCSTIA